jgi:hypothetical protein
MPLNRSSSFPYELILHLCQFRLTCVRLMLQGIRRADFRRNSKPQKSDPMRSEATEKSGCAASVMEIMNTGFSNLEAFRFLSQAHTGRPSIRAAIMVEIVPEKRSTTISVGLGANNRMTSWSSLTDFCSARTGRPFDRKSFGPFGET